MATVAYVAPELVTDGHADARTDVYSAGIVLFEMLTGKVPYDGDDPVEVAWQHVDHDVPAPSTIVRGLPPALDDLVARATRRDPGGRPTDAGALLAEVQTVKDDLGAQNAETALLRQVPALQPTRHAALDATALVPAVNATSVEQRPSWARLPEQAPRPPRRAGSTFTSTGKPPGGRKYDRRRILLMSAVAVMVLVVIGSTWWVTMGRYTDAPNLVNMTKAQAELYARQHHFEIFYSQPAYSDTAPKDAVLDQKPKAAEKIVKGGTLTLTLSLGPEQFPVPDDLVGHELSAVQGELDGLGLKLKQGKGQYSDTVPEGSVVSTDPKAGTQLKKGDTVTVVVSQGKAPISVPDLTGKNINDARNQLQSLGLAVDEKYVDGDQPADQVISQSPKPGTGASQNDTITLNVSKGPPLIAIPDVQNQPCQQAQQALQQAGLAPQVAGNPGAFAHGTNPPAGTQVPGQTAVQLLCF
jgi:serine/threonine-protein kinase